MPPHPKTEPSPPGPPPYPKAPQIPPRGEGALGGSPWLGGEGRGGSGDFGGSRAPPLGAWLDRGTTPLPPGDATTLYVDWLRHCPSPLLKRQRLRWFVTPSHTESTPTAKTRLMSNEWGGGADTEREGLTGPGGPWHIEGVLTHQGVLARGGPSHGGPSLTGQGAAHGGWLHKGVLPRGSPGSCEGPECPTRVSLAGGAHRGLKGPTRVP